MTGLAAGQLAEPAARVAAITGGVAEPVVRAAAIGPALVPGAQVPRNAPRYHRADLLHRL
jgi:hypothetical protein